MNAPAHLIVCDDEAELREMIAEYLTRRGFSVSLAANGADLREKMAEVAPDLILLDINMPGEDGLSVLRGLRGTDQTPVIMLTAAGETIDRILGLEMGADDYLAKPANPRELLARIRAILRRSNTHSAVAVLEIEDLVLNQSRRELRLDGELKELTSTEFSILQLLMQRSGEVVDKKDLYLAALGREPVAYDRSIDMHVSNLRRKLGPARDGSERIETIRGFGYLYRCQAD